MAASCGWTPTRAPGGCWDRPPAGTVSMAPDLAAISRPRRLFQSPSAGSGGATFPRVAHFAATAAAVMVAGGGATAERREAMRILLVEDDKDLQRLLKKALGDAGYVVDTAGDGEEGHFLGDTEPYAAVILDLGLPKMD